MHPVKGARNWRDAAFEAVAATTMVYFRASGLWKSLKESKMSVFVWIYGRHCSSITTNQAVTYRVFQEF